MCSLMNGCVVLFTSLICSNPKKGKEKEKPHFLETALINALVQNFSIMK